MSPLALFVSRKDYGKEIPGLELDSVGDDLSGLLFGLVTSFTTCLGQLSRLSPVLLCFGSRLVVVFGLNARGGLDVCSISKPQRLAQEAHRGHLISNGFGSRLGGLSQEQLLLERETINGQVELLVWAIGRQQTGHA